MMQVFVVCAAALIIFLVCCRIIFGGEDDEDVRGYSRPYRAPTSRNKSSARAKSTLRILEHGRNESRPSLSPHAERNLVTALANRLLSNESNNLTAEDLRERARNMRQDQQEALKRANRAHKKGDYEAAARHKRDAREIQSSMEFLNQVAAEVIFIKKNKVLYLSLSHVRDETMAKGPCMLNLPFCRGSRAAQMEWSISTVCTSRKLLDMQSTNSTRRRPPSGMTEWSALSSVRPPLSNAPSPGVMLP
jgi:hypothetical protein